MEILRRQVAAEKLRDEVRARLKQDELRFGLISSLDGSQVITLILNNSSGDVELWQSDLDGNTYPALSLVVPQAHWFERALRDLFGITPAGHPRLKSIFVKEALAPESSPLRTFALPPGTEQLDMRNFAFMQVQGQGVYELPVGPVHAGIIEPGHFRLSCFGEIIENLELRFGFLHRGVEKRLTEVPWQKARFVAESVASDTALGHALAHSIAIESMLGIRIPARAQFLRTLALEIERIAMHASDVGGMAVDLGFLGVSASYSRLRGTALRLAELLSGSRFLRGFVRPGGVASDPGVQLAELAIKSRVLHEEISRVSDIFIHSTDVNERLSGTGVVSRSLASDFGLVGVAARGSGVGYDCRVHFEHAMYPELSVAPAVQSGGDALARTLVRIQELETSFAIVQMLCKNIPEGPVAMSLPETLPSDAVGLGIVEAFRGELIHLVFTDSAGAVKRYIVKDPSFNNWTGMAIAARNNLIADFPVCNKSFSLSYSGHDL